MINKELQQVFEQIGLSRKHLTTYLAMLGRAPRTPLQLARATKINRSSLYRYLEEMREKGLVELVLADKASKYGVSPEGLESYLAREQERVLSLERTIPQVRKMLLDQPEEVAGTEVKYYQGREGLRQMLWRVVSAKDEFVGLGYENWNTSVGKNYAEKLRNRMLETGVKSREIQNEPDDSFEYTNLGEDYGFLHESRKLDKKVLEIKHDTYIYNDVFAFYYFYEGELFGVEIHNKEIAKTQKQIFEILWEMAKKKK